jgi:hypothetical protein
MKGTLLKNKPFKVKKMTSNGKVYKNITLSENCPYNIGDKVYQELLDDGSVRLVPEHLIQIVPEHLKVTEADI